MIGRKTGHARREGAVGQQPGVSELRLRLFGFLHPGGGYWKERSGHFTALAGERDDEALEIGDRGSRALSLLQLLDPFARDHHCCTEQHDQAAEQGECDQKEPGLEPHAGAERGLWGFSVGPFCQDGDASSLGVARIAGGRRQDGCR